MENKKRPREEDEDIPSSSSTTSNKRPKHAIIGPAPFSDENSAIEERENCDYSVKITLEMVNSGTASRKVRVYADGIYDLFHYGHQQQLLQIKQNYPNVYLIVGVCNDLLTHENKGMTVMTMDERYAGVAHSRYVDEVVRDAPWVLNKEFLDYHKIDFVAHDDIPYNNGEIDDVYHEIKKRGMFLVTQRTEGISTSELVFRIVRDYDTYVRRNLARGYSPKDMNVSFLNAKKFLFQNKMGQLKDKIEGKRNEIIHKWEEKSREIIGNFIDLFGQEGRLNAFWQESKGRIRQALSPNNSPQRSPNSDQDRDSTSPPPAKYFKFDTNSREDSSDEDDDDEEQFKSFHQMSSNSCTRRFINDRFGKEDTQSHNGNSTEDPNQEGSSS